jgi:hypothetical protein
LIVRRPERIEPSLGPRQRANRNRVQRSQRQSR